MPQTLDLFYGLCAASLLGYVVGWPVGHLGTPGGRRLRFVFVAALTGGGVLLARGWAPAPAVLLGLFGALVAVGVDELIRGSSPAPLVPEGARSNDPVGADRAAAPSADAELPVPDRVHDEASVSRSQRTLHGEPVAEPTPRPSRPGRWHEPAQSTSPGTTAAAPAGGWDEPGANATSPLPVLGRKTSGMDDVDLEQLYEEVDAALHVVPAECPHCGDTGNEADARFCKKCSAPLKPWRCHKCGRVNDIDASFCVRCREPLQMLASPLDVEVLDE